MISAFVSLAILGFLLGGGLSLAAKLLAVESNPLADELENILPGLQCGQCSFPGCRGAAEALSSGGTDITLCPPGGTALVATLAEKLQVTADFSGLEMEKPKVALIDEQACIGCTKCIQVCPTDAIIGAPKLMHTVVPDACTGCDKCGPICPAECIDMIPEAEIPVTLQSWHWPKPEPIRAAA
ncbi:MAG: electron transporter RnfB [Hyphomicrobiales bacterium]|nr:MAG: electron transporter RnfB [Hyphomicrobiales bacterium]